MSDILAGLTPAQREAATHRDGPLLIIAGAGSGKTRTVTRRIAHLVATGVPPGQILAITFTNKAAGEMRERIDALLPAVARSAGAPTVATFHAFAVKVLRRFARAAGLDPRFAILDPRDRLALVREAAVSARVDLKKTSAHALAERVGRAKERMDDEAFAREALGELDRAAAAVLPVYRELQRRRGALDFDDLVAETVRLLEGSSEVRELLLDELRYVSIDEYQDTNHAQYRLANLLAGERRNLAVVGDPDQSIYAWRGADMRNILRFEDDYPDAKVVLLEHNYRSSGRILAAANALIAHNSERKEKQLLPTGEEGRRIDVLPCSDPEMEADAIARRIKRLLGDGVPPGEVAVAFRAKAMIDPYEQALARHGIPATVVGATSFFDRREIKDALCLVRLGVNPRDDLAAVRALRLTARGVGKRTLDQLYAYQRRTGCCLVEACERAQRVGGLTPERANALMDFARIVRSLEREAQASAEHLVNASIASGRLLERHEEGDGEEARHANLRRLAAAARGADRRAGGGARAAREFLDRLALIDAQDRDDEDSGSERVVLTTVHASKGLEFDVVFVPGLEEGLFPHHRAVEEGSLEEERRLAYVAFTRARKLLVLSYAEQRAQRGGRGGRRRPSCFLYELPGELLWDPQLREPLVLPDPAEASAATAPARASGPRSRFGATPAGTKLVGLPRRASSGPPLWARGLVGPKPK
ncbi:MAG: ATP-dependent DNA helicase PcrA [Planctomycetota bacterium]|nr:MAG: ATP-dependent DNA helicase PcrA [Planctomycetota bacterium]